MLGTSDRQPVQTVRLTHYFDGEELHRLVDLDELPWDGWDADPKQPRQRWPKVLLFEDFLPRCWLKEQQLEIELLDSRQCLEVEHTLQEDTDCYSE